MPHHMGHDVSATADKPICLELEGSDMPAIGRAHSGMQRVCLRFASAKDALDRISELVRRQGRGKVKGQVSFNNCCHCPLYHKFTYWKSLSPYSIQSIISFIAHSMEAKLSLLDQDEEAPLLVY